MKSNNNSKRLTRKEYASAWITENETDLHQYIYDNRGNARKLVQVLARIKRDGTPHQYVNAFNYAKEVKTC